MKRETDLPLVSVIIPTYNQSRLLRLAIESVLAQTYSNVETVVVDDGSTDDTATVAAEYSGRITYIRQENQEDYGITATNVGIQAASGEYVGFLDHDDLFMPTKIERQVKVLDGRPDIGLVHCGYYYIDKEGNYLEKDSFLPDGSLKDLVCGNPIWSGGPLIRRKCLDETGGFSEIWASDWEMWLRIARAGYQFACIQEPLGAYRILPGSMMSNVNKLEEASFAILDKTFANPRLPAEVVAVKTQAYSMMRFFVSCRYYAAGLWDDGQRNLAEALALRPHLREHTMEVLELLADDALSPRVSEPLRFVEEVMDHLPPAAESLLRYRARLRSKVHVGLSLRNYGKGNIAEAKQLLTEAIAIDSNVLEQPEGFAKSLVHYALRLPVSSPRHYAETVLQNLPPEARRLEHLRLRVLGDVSIGSAFEDYFAGRRGLVASQVLTGLRYRPAWLTNRGVVSIFLRSLPALLAKERATG